MKLVFSLGRSLVIIQANANTLRKYFSGHFSCTLYNILFYFTVDFYSTTNELRNKTKQPGLPQQICNLFARAICRGVNLTEKKDCIICAIYSDPSPYNGGHFKGNFLQLWEHTYSIFVFVMGLMVYRLAKMQVPFVT